METLTIIAIILLLILNVLFISVLVVAWKFLQDLRLLLTLLRHEADKVTVDLAELRSKVRSGSSLFGLALSLITKRKLLKTASKAWRNYR